MKGFGSPRRSRQRHRAPSITKVKGSRVSASIIDTLASATLLAIGQASASDLALTASTASPLGAEPQYRTGRRASTFAEATTASTKKLEIEKYAGRRLPRAMCLPQVISVQGCSSTQLQHLAEESVASVDRSLVGSDTLVALADEPQHDVIFGVAAKALKAIEQCEGTVLRALNIA